AVDCGYSHGRPSDAPTQEDHHARCLAGGAGAHLRAPRPSGGGTRADARQPPGRPGPALVLEVGDRPGDQPAPPRAAAAARPRGRRRHPGAGHHRLRPVAVARVRPTCRDRGKVSAEVTWRLGEALGGIRIVKAYRAERSERLVFTRGANTWCRNIATTMTGISGVGAFATVIIGAIGIL